MFDILNYGDYADLVKFDPKICRGLDIYTGFIVETNLNFEVKNPKGKIVEPGSICSGGEYLVTKFKGDPFLGSGISIGISRLVWCLSQKNKNEVDEQKPVLVCIMDEKYLDKLAVNFKSIKIQNDQIIENKITDIDSRLLEEIKSQLGNTLNVSSVDLKKYDTEAIKSLFMNGSLYRVSKNIVISEDQKNQLIEIIDSLPENFSVTNFKEKSSLTRKYAIPFLEFLDKELITKKIDSSGLRKKIS